MKNWVFLVGMFMLSVSIIIFGVLLSQAIEQTRNKMTGQYKQRYFEKRVR